MLRHRVPGAIVLLLAAVVAGCGSTGAGKAPGAAPAPSPTTTTAPVPVAGPCGLTGSLPAPWPDRPRYRARLDLEAGGARVTGSLSVTFTPTSDTDRLVFRLWANSPRPARAGGRLEVTAASVDGQPVPGAYEPGNAGPGTPGTIFRIDGRFPSGRGVRAELSFTLAVPGPVNDRVSRVGSSVRLGSVLPTLSWIRGSGWQVSPAVDGFAEAAASEVADYDVVVNVPPGSRVLATGEEEAPGHFVARGVRDWSASVGRFRLGEARAQSGRTRVIVGVSDDAPGDPVAMARDAAAVFDGYADRYGPSPFPVLSVAVTPQLTGGIEFPEHIQLGAGVPREHLVHEIAHQWFYALVGNDQYRDPWLDEALSQYAELRALGRLDELRGRAVPAAGRGHAGDSMAFWASRPSIYFASVYLQGAQALLAFADVAGGTDALDCGLRRYVLQDAYRVATPADLLAALREQTGVAPGPALAPYGLPATAGTGAGSRPGS